MIAGKLLVNVIGGSQGAEQMLTVHDIFHISASDLDRPADGVSVESQLAQGSRVFRTKGRQNAALSRLVVFLEGHLYECLLELRRGICTSWIRY
jgi:hypothetical protein